jgi:uncharacterized repeat protein (TIGR03803 family)
LYGTTTFGGNGGAGICPYNDEDVEYSGCGTVFKLTLSGSSYTFSTPYKFNGLSDGFYPSGQLIVDGEGNIFGATGFGGIYGSSTSCGAYGSSGSGFYGCGTIFKLALSGSSYAKSTLYKFEGSTGDGSNPYGGLTGSNAVAAELYGTTSSGGSSNCGTVFKVSASGTESVLHNFDCNQSQLSGAILGTSELYLSDNASSNCCGAVFETSPTSGSTTKLYSFTGAPDGKYPTTPFPGLDGAPGQPGYLAVDSSGDVYGFTAEGGSTTHCTDGCGTIFELTNGSGSAKKRLRRHG